MILSRLIDNIVKIFRVTINGSYLALRKGVRVKELSSSPKLPIKKIRRLKKTFLMS